MTRQDAILEIERGFWTSGANYYKQHLDDVCILAFTEMTGAFDREQIASTVTEANRWNDLSIEVKAFLEPAPQLVLLTYTANARRKDNQPYAAVVSSGYRNRDGAWKMVFHQQTPLPEKNNDSPPA